MLQDFLNEVTVDGHENLISELKANLTLFRSHHHHHHQSADVKLSRRSAQTLIFGRRRALKLQEDAARAVMGC
ncbi:hypothetical protein PAMP_023493 [Pampus punctatissimus]